MKNDEVINYLQKKCVSNATINRILKYDSLYNNDIDLLERLKNIYDLLGFANLSDDDIENLILKNISVLDISKSELCKVSSVLEMVDMDDDIANYNDLAKGIINYKRVFMRNLVAKKAGRSAFNSISFLTAHDSACYGHRHSFASTCWRALNINCTCDDELEEYLNDKLMINGKAYSVDDYIKIQSSIFYRRFLQHKINKEKEGKKL